MNEKEIKILIDEANEAAKEYNAAVSLEREEKDSYVVKIVLTDLKKSAHISIPKSSPATNESNKVLTTIILTNVRQALGKSKNETNQ